MLVYKRVYLRFQSPKTHVKYPKVPFIWTTFHWITVVRRSSDMHAYNSSDANSRKSQRNEHTYVAIYLSVRELLVIWTKTYTQPVENSAALLYEWSGYTNCFAPLMRSNKWSSAVTKITDAGCNTWSATKFCAVSNYWSKLLSKLSDINLDGIRCTQFTCLV